MIDLYRDSCGRLPALFTKQQIMSFVAYMHHLPARPDTKGNTYRTISNRAGIHRDWFMDHVLGPINRTVGVNSQLVFAEMIDCSHAGNVHHDLKLSIGQDQQHWLTFLLPCSVDNDVAQCHRTSTMIFDQNIGKQALQQDHDPLLYERFPTIDNNVSDLVSGDLAHVTPEWLPRLSIKQDLDWQAGDVLWWDGGLAHCSTDLSNRNIARKLSIICFTSIPR